MPKSTTSSDDSQEARPRTRFWGPRAEWSTVICSYETYYEYIDFIKSWAKVWGTVTCIVSVACAISDPYLPTSLLTDYERELRCGGCGPPTPTLPPYPPTTGSNLLTEENLTLWSWYLNTACEYWMIRTRHFRRGLMSCLWCLLQMCFILLCIALVVALLFTRPKQRLSNHLEPDCMIAYQLVHTVVKTNLTSQVVAYDLQYFPRLNLTVSMRYWKQRLWVLIIPSPVSGIRLVSKMRCET